MGRVSWTSAVAAWYSEIYYFGGCDAPYNNINLTWDTYTQVMWADTAAIGCGQAMCNNYIISPGSAGYTPKVKLFVCNYCPGGNVRIPGQGYAQYCPWKSADSAAKCSD
ncbi:cysteine-rich secretory protein 1-like [Paramacrobiotus metropolitanus]|uniref:cysteine-rich secretory protein 1-like n=1 Tax=Paramacrobiotus metropolitanus TaxID=2943436 RepID=UPI002445CEA2|nr:cysteine-rich secretory protein 1-like [Paramacrobiotus metropolitanus]